MLPPSPLPPIALALVPGLLRARGLEVGRKQLAEASGSGAVPGRRLLTSDDLDAAERYFQGRAARGAWKGGAAALVQARAE